MLNAMRTYATEEQLQSNGLKTLCNLLESGKNVPDTIYIFMFQHNSHVLGSEKYSCSRLLIFVVCRRSTLSVGHFLDHFLLSSFSFTETYFR